KGVRARVGDLTVHVGTERLFREIGVGEQELPTELREFENAGRTAVLVGTSRGDSGEVTVVGVIAIADRVRAGAEAALEQLHAAGVRRIVMLTGDNVETVRAVAESLPGIDEYRAELL